MVLMSSRLIKKSLNKKSKLVLSTLVTTVYGIQTSQQQHRISFATDLAANFGCDQFEIMPAIVI